MTFSFNLIDEPWIRCADLQGKPQMVGLREVLIRASDFKEILGATPLETPALIRFLLAVLYHATGITDAEAWAGIWNEGRFPAQKVTGYLENHRQGFDLFGDRAFYQIPDMEMKDKNVINRLVHEVATGNNATLFDHSSDDRPLAVDFAAAARMLVVAQAYSLGFGKASSAKVKGIDVPRPYLTDGVALRGVTLWLSGDNLFQTLMMNLVPPGDSETGQAPWELAGPMSLMDRVENGTRVISKVRGIVDLYTVQSRMLRLLPDDDGKVRHVYFTSGRSVDMEGKDPMKVYVESKTEGVYPLGLRVDKAAWRDLHTFLQFGKLRNSILSFAALLIEEGELAPHYRFWVNVAGLATEPGKAGKFLLWRQERFSVPGRVLQNESLLGLITMAIQSAEEVAADLRSRVQSVVREIVPPEGRPDPADVRRLVDSLDPLSSYWSRLEHDFLLFMTRLTDDPEDALSRWYAQVEKQAARSFAETCDYLGRGPKTWKALARVSGRFTADLAKRAQDNENAGKKK